MPKTRPAYPPEFRRQMVELVRVGRTPEELAAEFEPTAQSIRNWVTQADRDEGKRLDGLSTQEREERVADITYVPTDSGFLYLAVVLDAFSRKVVGWSMATHLRTQLVLDGLDMALSQRRPQGVIHHSDQGCQYTSLAFGQRCRQAGVRPSMGSVGDCYDNALCESFFATLDESERFIRNASFWTGLGSATRPRPASPCSTTSRAGTIATAVIRRSPTFRP